MADDPPTSATGIAVAVLGALFGGFAIPAGFLLDLHPLATLAAPVGGRAWRRLRLPCAALPACCARVAACDAPGLGVPAFTRLFCPRAGPGGL